MLYCVIFRCAMPESFNSKLVDLFSLAFSNTSTRLRGVGVLGDAAAASVGRVESLLYKHAPLLLEKASEVLYVTLCL